MIDKIKSFVMGPVKKPKLFAISFIAVVLLFYIVSYLFFNYYTATARLIVTGKQQGKDVQVPWVELKNIAASIKNPDMVKKAAEGINFEKQLSTEQKQAKILSMIKIKSIPREKSIVIYVNSKKPVLASNIANKLAELFVASSIDKVSLKGKEAASAITRNTKELRDDIEKAALDIREFNNSIGAKDIRKEYEINKGKIDALYTNLAAVKAEAQGAELAYSSIKRQLDSGKDPRELLEVQNDDSYLEIESEYLVIKSEIEAMLKKYNENHPDVVSRQNKLKAADDILKARAEAVINELKANYDAFLNHQKNIEAMIESESSKQLKLEEQIDKQNLLLRALNEKETTYKALIDKLESEFNRLVSGTTIALLNQAYVPTKKSTLPIKNAIILSLIISFIVVGFLDKTKIEKEPDKEKTPDKGMYIERVREE